MDASSPCTSTGDAVTSFQFSAANPSMVSIVLQRPMDLKLFASFAHDITTQTTQTMNIPFAKLQCAQCRNWGGNFFSKCNATDTRK